MRRFIAVLGGLLILPAFAEVVPVDYYDDVVEYSEELPSDNSVITEDIQTSEVDTPVALVDKINKKTSTSRNASRAVPSTASVTSSNSYSRGNTAGRTVSSRSSNSVRARENASTTAMRNGTQQNVTTRRNTNKNTSSARSAELIQSDTVNTPLYYSSSSARVSVRPTSTTASVRAPTVRVASTGMTSDSGTYSSIGPSLDELAQLTDFCKAQYTECMDNFCDILDDNQGRCSCSANIKNYEKTELGLKEATTELQEIAQKIQYIGLTKDEVETLFTQTEAEMEMQSRSDTTQLKTDLEKIKGMIVDVKTGNALSSDSGINMDLTNLLSFDLGDSAFDLNSLFSGTSSTSSISNQRGSELYKTATARCKSSVLDSCKAQGVDITVVSNSYDLEIDKQCISYERSLTDANTQMESTVRNAKNVLQKARLVVAQQKNAYDLRGCINALDSCMTDEFVCGSDYEDCLDPTGRYIVNGEIVIGSEPGISGGTVSGDLFTTGLYTAWNYNSTNAWQSDVGTISDFIDQEITAGTDAPPAVTRNMVDYLQHKIGYIDSDGKVNGMCASILNKCQDYTYDADDYEGSNDVIRGYLERVLIQIKSVQDEVLSEYAEECITDVASCLSTNNYDAASPNTAVNACSSVIKTCASTIYGSTDSAATQNVVDSAAGE